MNSTKTRRNLENGQHVKSAIIGVVQMIYLNILETINIKLLSALNADLSTK
jgi:hypothetical protein